MSTNWRTDLENAPKDRPVLGWCKHDADPGHDPVDYHILSDYAVNADALGHVEDGPHVLEWTDQMWENTDEYGSGYWIPGWWTRRGSYGEVFAFPIAWAEITEPTE